MDSTRLYELFRSEVADIAEPIMGRRRGVPLRERGRKKTFCRLTGGLPDATTPAVTQVTLTAGNPWAALSPLILKIRGINGADGRHSISELRTCKSAASSWTRGSIDLRR